MGFNSNFDLKIENLTDKEINQNICFKCQSPLVPKSKFCNQCGRPVSSNLIGSIIAEFRKTNGYAEMALNKDGKPSEECTWYDMVMDVQTFSSSYPGFLFTIDQRDEEGGLVRYYFFKGKTQEVHPEIIYPHFDKRKIIKRAFEQQ